MNALVLTVLLATQAKAPAPPPPTKADAVGVAWDFTSPVVDLAGLLPDDVERDLAGRLRAHKEQTGVAIGVVLLDGLGAQTLAHASDTASTRLRADLAQGAPHVAIVVALRERQLRLEIGHGLEYAFADRANDRLLEDAIAAFRAGDGPGAVLGLADQVIARTANPPMSPTTRAVLMSLAAGAAVGVLGLGLMRLRRRA